MAQWIMFLVEVLSIVESEEDVLVFVVDVCAQYGDYSVFMCLLDEFQLELLLLFDVEGNCLFSNLVLVKS